MQSILDKLAEWLKELLISGILGNLSGMFDTVNTKVGEIAGEVGMTPSAWNGGVFNLIRSLSETVIIPIAGIILTFVMCYELIQLVIEKNNLHDNWLYHGTVGNGVCRMWESPGFSMYCECVFHRCNGLLCTFPRCRIIRYYRYPHHLLPQSEQGQPL